MTPTAPRKSFSGYRSRPLGWELLLVTDPTFGLDVPAAVRRALPGAQPGRVALWLRAPGVPSSTRHEWLRALRGPTREAGVLLLAHGFEPGLETLDIDGTHLPSRMPRSARSIRALRGGHWLVGRSCHDAEALRAAAEEGADYATLSPFFPVPGKGRGLGPSRFARLLASARLPVVALGGLGADEAGLRDAVRAGASAVAVRRAVFATPDPAEAVARILTRLDRVHAEPS